VHEAFIPRLGGKGKAKLLPILFLTAVKHAGVPLFCGNQFESKQLDQRPPRLLPSFRRGCVLSIAAVGRNAAQKGFMQGLGIVNVHGNRFLSVSISCRGAGKRRNEYGVFYAV
jgi:hypothetical protein